MEYAVKIDHMTKDFGNFRLEDVSLAIPGGTIWGLIGENGAGKSTLIKCLLGILRPTAGAVEVLAGEGVAQVGFVPDTCPFDLVLKVSQVGKVLAGIYPDWDEGLWQSYLARFDLSPKAKVKDLSRGMGMKLSIAAALSHHPRLLVLDEATAGLDPVVRDEILDIFLEFISDEDHAILISSHITSDLEKVCDYVSYIHRGRLTVSGAKDELLAQYGKVTCTREELAAIDPALIVGERVGEYGCVALVNDREALRRTCPDLAIDPPTLEDIMIFTTRGRSTALNRPDTGEEERA